MFATVVSHVLLSFLAMSAAEPESLVWVEAEQFARSGGWTNDPQFIDMMGSPYLMAIGLGNPVDDAVTTVAPVKPGEYRLWVRTRDWVPDYHPGKFRVILDGKPVDRVFGANGQPGWRWEDGGVHALGSEPVEVRLRDVTGYYGRCDAIVLCPNLDWTPPDDLKALAALRERFGGVSRKVVDRGQFDVVVVGGGLAGCTTAVSAARLGARVVLIQNRPVLGGNASVENLVPPVGVWPSKDEGPLDPRETGILEEYRTAGNQKTDEAKLYSSRLLRFVRAEPNLDLFLNTHATGVEMQKPGTIGAVLAVDTRTGQRMRFRGRVFVDCTGDSTVGVAAGAEYRHGKEPRSMYNEPMAPEDPSPHTMGNSLKYIVQPVDQPEVFQAPEWALKFPHCEVFTPNRHPRLSPNIGWQWMIELGGTQDTYRESEEIRDDLLRLVYGLWDHTKNHCAEHSEKAKDFKLAWVSHVVAKRENRRLIGDHVLNENDVAQQTLFDDRVAYGAWCCDDHYSEGFFFAGKASYCPYKGVQFSIPYRCLYSKNVDNLLMAGRNISATHVGMSNTRVMITCAVMAQATGTAAGMCIAHDTTPRGVYQNHLEELQQRLLKSGAYLIRLANRDSHDLARQATVIASSEAPLDGDASMAAGNVTNGFARMIDGNPNAWAADPKTNGPHWVELSWPKPQKFNMVHISFQTKDLAPRTFRVKVLPEGLPGTSADDWRTVSVTTSKQHRRHEVVLDGNTAATKLRVELDEPAGICEIRVYGEPERVLQISRRAMAARDLPDTKPELGWDDSVLWATGIDPRKLPGVVVDDTQAEQQGRWPTSDFSRPFVGVGYRHDGNRGKGHQSLRFVATLPSSGHYEVRLAYRAVANRASNVPVVIHTSDGPKTVYVDQRTKPPIDDLWVSLGTFPFGPTAIVVIGTEGTDSYVAADAVQWLPAGK